jgi:long-chain acyl-CoA synthetase
MDVSLESLPPEDIFRVVRDIFIDELSRSRRRGFDAGRALEWTADTPVHSAELDSFERFTIASRLNETFALYESGVEDNLLRCKTLGETVEVISAGLRYYSDTLAFYSGGTTGAPKPRQHRSDLLLQEVEEWAALLSDRRRVIVTVPVHHIYGFLWGVLLPVALGAEVVEARRSLLTGGGRPRSGDLVVAVPFLWDRFGTGVSRWEEDVIGVSSTAPLPDDVASTLCGSGLSRCIEVYGSSETAGIGWRDRCDDGPFRVLPYWRRGEGRDDLLLRAIPGNGGDEEFLLPDRVNWVDTEHLVPQGRRDAVVQVGGENVDLEEVQRTIVSALETVSECAVRLDSDGRLKAFVVLQHGAESDADAGVLRDALRDVLSDAALPSAITIGGAIPRDENGKLSDW